MNAVKFLKVRDTGNEEIKYINVEHISAVSGSEGGITEIIFGADCNVYTDEPALSVLKRIKRSDYKTGLIIGLGDET